MIQPLNEGTQRFLKALASETRQEIMRTFAGGESLTVGEVGTRCALGQSTASEQLSLLRQSGLLTAVKQGKSVYYSADAESIRSSLGELQDYLARCC